MSKRKEIISKQQQTDERLIAVEKQLNMVAKSGKKQMIYVVGTTIGTFIINLGLNVALDIKINRLKKKVKKIDEEKTTDSSWLIHRLDSIDSSINELNKKYSYDESVVVNTINTAMDDIGKKLAQTLYDRN